MNIFSKVLYSNKDYDFITTISKYFSLISKIYLKKVPVKTNIILAKNIGFVNISSFRHINPIIF